MRTLVILNAAAGSASGVEDFESFVAPLGDVVVERTREAGDAMRLARAAAGKRFEMVVAAGGDGTLNEVVNGLMEGEGGDSGAGRLSAHPVSSGRTRGTSERPILGVLPLGTGNDFARAIGVPMEPAGAVAVLAAGRVMGVDVAELEVGGRDGEGGGRARRWFINASSCGVIGAIAEKTEKRAKEWWGSLAYVATAAKEASSMQPHRLRLMATDEHGAEEVLEMEAYAVFVGNGRTAGGGVPVAPGAVLDDGLLDMLVMPVMPLAEIALVLPKILMGHHRPEEDGLIFRRVAGLRVESEPPIPINADGELVGESPGVYRVVKKGLRVVVGEAGVSA